MSTYYFYYSSKSYKVLTLEHPVGADGRGNDILTTLAHDFQASLKPIAVRVVEQLTSQEKETVLQARKTAEYAHKALKGKDLYQEKRQELINTFQSARTPRWASIKFSKL